MTEYPHTTLIDTCALANLFYYVETCITLNLPLGSNFETIKTAMKQPLSDDSIQKIIDKGLKIFKYIKEKDSLNYISVFSKMEFFKMLINISFDNELTKLRIPPFIRAKKYLRTQINFDYEKNVVQIWKDSMEKLKENDIELVILEYESDVDVYEIYDICNTISSFVSLDLIDLYLFATALSQKIDVIITNDNEFKDILNFIIDKNEWEDVRTGICKAINCKKQDLPRPING